MILTGQVHGHMTSCIIPELLLFPFIHHSRHMLISMELYNVFWELDVFCAEIKIYLFLFQAKTVATSLGSDGAHIAATSVSAFHPFFSATILT